MVSSCAGSETEEVLDVSATLADRTVTASSSLDPIRLDHEEITELSLTMANPGDEPVTVSHVRIEGGMLGLIFLSYDTGIRETLAPGERRTVTFAIDFFDLEGQAHGLLRSELRLYGPDREPLSSTPMVVDGRGSPLSTMAVFNIVLAVTAAVSLGWNVVRLLQRRLPNHAVIRGLRFAHSGVAAGLAFSAALSTLRLWPLTDPAWMLLTAAATVGAFAFGYSAPGADEDLPVVIDLVAREQDDDGAAFRITRPLPDGIPTSGPGGRNGGVGGHGGLAAELVPERSAAVAVAYDTSLFESSTEAGAPPAAPAPAVTPPASVPHAPAPSAGPATDGSSQSDDAFDREADGVAPGVRAAPDDGADGGDEPGQGSLGLPPRVEPEPPPMGRIIND
ncbi:MAG: hypothetical protein AAGD35_10755 [Actinomycetota bacterium]